MFCAVIVAAGSSRRAGFDKLAAPLAGKPVLCHSVEAFAETGCESIVVVCPEERWKRIGMPSSVRGVPLLRVEGGKERQDSVAAGLAALPEGAEWVAVHDGARPLISPDAIRDCLQAARTTGIAACAHPVVDTLKRVSEEGRTLPEIVSRDHLWGMETPQIAAVSLLRQAYATVRQQQIMVTDEVSAMQLISIPATLVQGGINFKITLPGDLAMAELAMQQQ